MSTTRATSAPAWPTTARPGSRSSGQARSTDLGNHCPGIIGGADDGTPLVCDAQAASYVQVLERDPVVAKLQRESRQRPRGPPQRIDGRNLRSDVHMDSDEPQTRAAAALAVDRPRVLERHAELVDLQAG